MRVLEMMTRGRQLVAEAAFAGMNHSAFSKKYGTAHALLPFPHEVRNNVFRAFVDCGEDMFDSVHVYWTKEQPHEYYIVAMRNGELMPFYNMLHDSLPSRILELAQEQTKPWSTFAHIRSLPPYQLIATPAFLILPIVEWLNFPTGMSVLSTFFFGMGLLSLVWELIAEPCLYYRRAARISREIMALTEYQYQVARHTELASKLAHQVPGS